MVYQTSLAANNFMYFLTSELRNNISFAPFASLRLKFNRKEAKGAKTLKNIRLLITAVIFFWLMLKTAFS
jgi:hypothetical protein